MFKRILTLMLMATSVWAGSYTSNKLHLYKPDAHENGVATLVNDNFTQIDSSVAVLSQPNIFTAFQTFSSSIAVSSMSIYQLRIGTPTYSGTEPVVINGTTKIFGPLGAVLSLCDQNGQNCSNISSSTISGVTAGIGLAGGGTSGGISLNLRSDSTNYIQNSNSLQSGATFYVSSGTVSGQLSAGTGIFSSASNPQITINNPNTAGPFTSSLALGFNNSIKGYLSQSNSNFLCSDLSTVCLTTPLSYGSSTSGNWSVDTNGKMSVGQFTASKSTATIWGNLLIGTGYSTVTNAPVDGLRVKGNVLLDSLTSGQCVQTGTGGLLTVTGAACSAGGGASLSSTNTWTANQTFIDSVTVTAPVLFSGLLTVSTITLPVTGSDAPLINSSSSTLIFQVPNNDAAHSNKAGFIFKNADNSETKLIGGEDTNANGIYFFSTRSLNGGGLGVDNNGSGSVGSNGRFTFSPTGYSTTVEVICDIAGCKINDSLWNRSFYATSSSMSVTGSSGFAVPSPAGANITYGVTASSITATSFIQHASLSKATLATTTPNAVGQTYYCNDCTALTLCVSTGTAQGAWASPTSKTTACN